MSVLEDNCCDGYLFTHHTLTVWYFLCEKLKNSNKKDAKDYITLVLKGYNTFEKAAKEVGVLRDSLV